MSRTRYRQCPDCKAYCDCPEGAPSVGETQLCLACNTVHENVATVLVHPCALADLELELMALDLRVWPIHSAPICADGPREAFQIRRRLVMAAQGAWDLAVEKGELVFASAHGRWEERGGSAFWQAGR